MRIGSNTQSTESVCTLKEEEELHIIDMYSATPSLSVQVSLAIIDLPMLL